MLIYNSTKDRSEEAGWKKVCDEHVPTEEEQNRWSNIVIVFTLLISVIAFL
jgi:hypothetical protein